MTENRGGEGEGESLRGRGGWGVFKFSRFWGRCPFSSPVLGLVPMQSIKFKSFLAILCPIMRDALYPMVPELQDHHSNQWGKEWSSRLLVLLDEFHQKEEPVSVF